VIRLRSRTRLTLVASVLAAVTVSTVLPSGAEDQTLPVNSRLISNFKVGSDQTRFGSFEFIGGLELSSPSSMLGAMSAIRLSADRQRFLGVMDTGFWYAGRFERGLNGELTGIVDFSVASMLDADGESSEEKWRVDAEGLAVRGDEVLVSFERRSRVDVYPADAPGSSRPTGTLPLQIPSRELRNNRGLEADHGGAGHVAAGGRGGCRLREKSRCQW
jgi:hypothetical protein